MTLQTDLAALEASGLVRLSQIEPELEYLFRHALIQDAAYNSLLKTDRRRLHLSVGEALERLYPDRADTQELAPLLGQHFDEGGDEARALKYFTLAGDAAARVYANSEAVTLYTRALDIAQRINSTSGETLLHLYAQRGRAFELSNQYDQALRNYVAMEAAAHARSDRALELSALMLRTTLHCTPTPAYDLTQGQQLADQALSLARELNDRPAEAKILWNLLLLNTHKKGHIREAIEYGERSLAIAREIGLREQIAFSLHDLANTYLFIGEMPRAQAALEESQQLWQELNNLPMLADSLCNTCGFCALAGQYDRALALSEKAFNLSQAIDNLWDQSYSRFYVGLIHFDRGETDQALQTMEQCRQLGEQAGFLVAMMQTRAEMAFIYATLGDLRRAYALTDFIFAKSKELQVDTHPYTWGLLAYLHVLDEKLEGAEPILQQFPDDSETGELTSGGFFVPLAQTELALKKGNYLQGVEMTERFKVMMRQFGIHQFLPDVLYTQSRAFLGLGDLNAAYGALEEARLEAEALNARRTLWQILAALGRIEAQRGHPAEAQQFYRQAQAIIEYMADHISDSELRRTFLSQSQVRAVSDEL